MKKLIIATAIALSLGVTAEATLAPKHAIASKTTSTKQEKLAYYQKQIAALTKELKKLEAQDKNFDKSTEAYLAHLKKKQKVLNELKYYYNLILEL